MQKQKRGRTLVPQEEVRRILDAVPHEHRGIGFNRLLEGYHPYESIRRLEVSLAEEWAKENNGKPDGGELLMTLFMNVDENDPRRHEIPKDKREWEVADLIAATLMQWLPTNIGRAFMEEAFRRAGGHVTFTLPVVDEDRP